jgi:DNA repair exonuclease SbcCD nuclease subunit
MRYLIITDTHFGARKDDEIFLGYFGKFLEETFFPYIDQHKIDYVIHAGDFFDKRTSVNINTLSWARKHFLDPLKERKIQLDIIIGNHDTYFKNTNSTNSPSMLLKDYDNVCVYPDPIEQGPFLYVPWITSENRQTTRELIKKTDKKYVIGHLELVGYKMYEGTYCKDGMDPDIFSKFDIVMSGHFHTKNSCANVHYLGCPWDLMVNDIHDIKGVHTFDDTTSQLEFIPNPDKMYIRVNYDEKKPYRYTVNELKEFENRHLRVYVYTKLDPVKYDKFCEVLANTNPLGVSYVDMTTNQLNNTGDVLADLSDDILTMIKKSLDEDYDGNLLFDDRLKPDLEQLLNDLYIEAIST